MIYILSFLIVLFIYFKFKQKYKIGDYLYYIGVPTKVNTNVKFKVIGYENGKYKILNLNTDNVLYISKSDRQYMKVKDFHILYGYYAPNNIFNMEK